MNAINIKASTKCHSVLTFGGNMSIIVHQNLHWLTTDYDGPHNVVYPYFRHKFRIYQADDESQNAENHTQATGQYAASTEFCTAENFSNAWLISLHFYTVKWRGNKTINNSLLLLPLLMPQPKTNFFQTRTFHFAGMRCWHDANYKSSELLAFRSCDSTKFVIPSDGKFHFPALVDGQFAWNRWQQQ